MLNSLTLADVAYEAWKEAVDNTLFRYAGTSLHDLPVTDLELREMFDEGWIPVSAAANLPRSDAPPDAAATFLLAS